MRYGFGAEAAPVAKKEGTWGPFWANLGQNLVTGLVGSIGLPGAPAVPAAPPAAAPPGAAPPAAAPLAAPSTVISVAKSAWPIIAVAGAGVVGLLAVIVLKKKRS